MKVKIEFDENLVEDEIVIKCRKLNNDILNVQQAIFDITSNIPRVSFFKEDKEYFLPLEQVLFFETANNSVEAHTADDVFNTRYKLYELEEVLPKNFVRVSKSTILNAEQVYSIERSLTSSSLIQFQSSHKQVYVSRLYFKDLKNKLDSLRQLRNN